MKSVRFSATLFSQMGGVHWQSRPGYFAQPVSRAVWQSNDLEQSVTALEASPQSSHHRLDAQSATPGVLTQTKIVLVGAGLNAVWENETSQEWLLWCNVCVALDWAEEQVLFFDTDTLSTEEAMYATMEEVIESGVDTVLSMHWEHPFNEMLAEGVRVLEVADLTTMLQDPHAKQAFYRVALELGHAS